MVCGAGWTYGPFAAPHSARSFSLGINGVGPGPEKWPLPLPLPAAADGAVFCAVGGGVELADFEPPELELGREPPLSVFRRVKLPFL